MNTINRKFICTLGICLLPVTSQASIINFDFTGHFILADNGAVVTDMPISASLQYDTVSGVGNSNMSITLPDAFFGLPATFHDITMTRQAGTNLIDGVVQWDWNGIPDNEIGVQWDATGLFNAINNYGLQAGDVISGTDLYHDTNLSGLFDAGDIYIADVGSAIPHSDSLQTFPVNEQGPAPIAGTSGGTGISEPAFAGITAYFDIGSGNSLHVTSVSAVPVPASVWLFASGLLGLIATARRKAA